MRFTKMHGAGNDFVVINAIEEDVPLSSASCLARTLCSRRTGIGADGLMLVAKAEGNADYRLLFYNSDGSLGEMCGNGARCIARYGYEHGLAGESQRIETTAGLVTGERIDRRRYRIRLNDPSVIDLHRRVNADGEKYDCAYMELGRPGLPHAVVQLPDFDTMDRGRLRELGRALRFADAFPKGANVNFVKLTGKNELKRKAFERGVEDFTLACGTGCGSSVTALTLLGLVSGREVLLHSDGGDLTVSVTCEGDNAHDIYLTGPTNMVCVGETLEI